MSEITRFQSLAKTRFVRLKEIEAERARLRMLSGTAIDPMENLPQGTARDIAADKLAMVTGQGLPRLPGLPRIPGLPG